MKALTCVAGAAVAAVVAMTATPSHALTIANGSVGFVPDLFVSVNSASGNIAADMTAKTYGGLIVNTIPTGNIPAATGVSVNSLTFQIGGGAGPGTPGPVETLSPSLVLTLNTAGGDITFTFTTTQTLNLDPTTAVSGSPGGHAGLLGEQVLGTLTGDTTGTFELGTIARLAQNCNQSTTTSLINCADTLAVGAAVTAPEPGSLALLGSALVGFGLFRRRRAAA